MTGTNHAITGAIIGSVVGSPIIALPVAVISHFVLDALPHYGEVAEKANPKRLHTIVIIDTILALSVIIYVLVAKPQHWPVMIATALLAMSPDVMWLPNYIRNIRKRALKSYNRLMHWHERIQRERVWGIIVEAAWLIAAVPVLITLS